mmetsp:Transcript_10876/g.17109  ORF Transcript_10876/g.17109 Transcript_10876/m.17109 type:complete len:582 (-) Transcript_10876:520-2265(-)
MNLVAGTEPKAVKNQSFYSASEETISGVPEAPIAVPPTIRPEAGTAASRLQMTDSSSFSFGRRKPGGTRPSDMKRHNTLDKMSLEALQRQEESAESGGKGANVERWVTQEILAVPPARSALQPTAVSDEDPLGEHPPQHFGDQLVKDAESEVKAKDSESEQGFGGAKELSTAEREVNANPRELSSQVKEVAGSREESGPEEPQATDPGARELGAKGPKGPGVKGQGATQAPSPSAQEAAQSTDSQPLETPHTPKGAEHARTNGSESAQAAEPAPTSSAPKIPVRESSSPKDPLGPSDSRPGGVKGQRAEVDGSGDEAVSEVKFEDAEAGGQGAEGIQVSELEPSDAQHLSTSSPQNPSPQASGKAIETEDRAELPERQAEGAEGPGSRAKGVEDTPNRSEGSWAEGSRKAGAEESTGVRDEDSMGARAEQGAAEPRAVGDEESRSTGAEQSRILGGEESDTDTGETKPHTDNSTSESPESKTLSPGGSKELNGSHQSPGVAEGVGSLTPNSSTPDSSPVTDVSTGAASSEAPLGEAERLKAKELGVGAEALIPPPKTLNRKSLSTDYATGLNGSGGEESRG